MRIGYVLYNERPLSGLIRSQVVDLLGHICRNNPTMELTLISFYQPWIYFKFRKEVKEMKTLLEKTGIRCKTNYFAFPERHFFENRTWIGIIKTILSPVFSSMLSGYDIIHCRGYFPSYVAGALKDKKKYHLVFDGRSLFPEESITRGKWTFQSDIFNYWKAIEKKTLDSADVAVGVSPAMVEKLSSVSPQRKIVYIPCCVNTARIGYNDNARASIREENGWKDKIVFIYVGSLGQRTWNNIDNYLCFLSNVLSSGLDAHFLIITRDQLQLNTLLPEKGIKPESVTMLSATGSQLSGWLSAADFGLQIMNMAFDYETRLGVKFVEYLSAGLPVITNKYAGAAAQIVQDNGLGIVLNERNRLPQGEMGKYRHSKITREKLARFAKEHFDIEKCAESYNQLYHSLEKR